MAEWIGLGFVAAVAVIMIWVRLAPISAKVWHRLPTVLPPGDYSKPGRFAAVRRTDDGQDALAAFDRIIRTTPRTRVLAGSPDEGMITYVTRSVFWGFPDLTSVSVGPGGDGSLLVQIHGRLRFGRSDLGVNRIRIEGWLLQLPAGTLQSLPE